MNKIEEAVEYMISVWDEVQGNWREHPDHVAQKFIEAEKEIQDQKVREHIDSVLPDEKWNENVEICDGCGIKWKKIGKPCRVCGHNKPHKD